MMRTYDFRVTVQPSDYAEKLHLDGNYLLKIFPSGMALYSEDDRTPSAYSCFLKNILKIDHSTAAPTILGIEHEEGSLTLCCDNALEIIQIINSRKQTSDSKLNLARKPAIRSNKREKKRSSKSELDVAESGGDFESVGSWLEWRKSKISTDIPVAKPSHPLSKLKDLDDSRYDYVQDFVSQPPSSVLDESFQYDYVRDFNTVIKRVPNKSLQPHTTSSSSEDEDYYY